MKQTIELSREEIRDLSCGRSVVRGETRLDPMPEPSSTTNAYTCTTLKANRPQAPEPGLNATLNAFRNDLTNCLTRLRSLETAPQNTKNLEARIRGLESSVKVSRVPIPFPTRFGTLDTFHIEKVDSLWGKKDLDELLKRIVKLEFLVNWHRDWHSEEAFEEEDRSKK